jgi:hypothetical protein
MMSEAIHKASKAQAKVMKRHKAAERCTMCQGEPAKDPHPCPYNCIAFGDKKFTCNCCSSCREECALKAAYEEDDEF